MIYCKKCKHFKKYSPWEFNSWDEPVCKYRLYRKKGDVVDKVTGIKKKGYMISYYPDGLSEYDITPYRLHYVLNKDNGCKYFNKDVVKK